LGSSSPHRCQAHTDALLRYPHTQATHLSVVALLPTWPSATLLPSPSPLLSHTPSQTQNLHPPTIPLLHNTNFASKSHKGQYQYSRLACPLLLQSCFLITPNTPPCRCAICLIPSSPSTTRPFILLCRQHCWPPGGLATGGLAARLAARPCGRAVSLMRKL
jgi:hypothetical protein